jgi:hypothetical protein
MRHRYLTVLTASASFAMLLTSVHISLADAIDGDWCKTDGKRMKIRGPEIVTPGGNQTRGDYTRHSFSYVVPAGEAGAGESVSITLLSEYLAHARQGSDTAPIQVWNRCPPGVADTGRCALLVAAAYQCALSSASTVAIPEIIEPALAMTADMP